MRYGEQPACYLGLASHPKGLNRLWASVMTTGARGRGGVDKAERCPGKRQDVSEDSEPGERIG